jgi:circadian clock protein KaiC
MADEPRQRSLERITTGVPPLDAVLRGGIPRNSLIFIAGLPGTGKTILSQQIVFANAARGHQVMYLSTLSEPAIKVLHFVQGFSFFRADLFGGPVFYGDLGSTLRLGGREGLLKELDQLVRTHRPEIVVIDSFKALRDFVPDPLTFREFVADIATKLSAWEVTTLLVGEYGADDIRVRPEFAVADGIVYLYGTEESVQQRRYLRIMKMRGTDFFGGEHYFDIDASGIRLYPRMVPDVVGEYALPDRRMNSAVSGLDEMLGGGILQSTSTLISGGSGSGKTLLALSFLVQAARAGQKGLFVSFEESRQQLLRNCTGLDWDIAGLEQRGLLGILHVSPSELNVDRHAIIIKEQAERMGAQMVAIDSLTAFQAAVPDPGKYQNYLWALNDHFKRHGVTLLMTAETPSLFAPLEISERALSHVVDNIVFLRYVETDGEIRRAIGVLKMRGSSHDNAMHELIIAPPLIAAGARLQLGDMLGAARDTLAHGEA